VVTVPRMAYTLTGLDNKVAVVTGAGRMRSIGRPIAVALARAGCDIVLTGTGRSPDRYPDDEKAAGWRDIESVADEVRAEGRRAIAVVSDVADLAAVERLADETLAEFGRVDIVVNNAGAARGEDRKPVIDLDPDLWRTVLDVNLTGSFLMSKVFGRHLVASGNGGSIVNISSIAGKKLSPNTSAYAASKAGLQALTACMAQEVAPDGVRVNAICPGVIDTSRMDDLGRGEVWDEVIRTLVPMGRAGTGEDIAHIVVYLCSDEGSWVTGQSWNVDGGTVVQH
jgi:3-oxoacyl-[acyl-carrier protein] reductase